MSVRSHQITGFFAGFRIFDSLANHVHPRRSVFSIYALLGVHPPEIEALRVSSDAETKFRCILVLQLCDSQFKAQLDFTCRLVSLIQELVPTRLAAAQPRAQGPGVLDAAWRRCSGLAVDQVAEGDSDRADEVVRKDIFVKNRHEYTLAVNVQGRQVQGLLPDWIDILTHYVGLRFARLWGAREAQNDVGIA